MKEEKMREKRKTEINIYKALHFTFFIISVYNSVSYVKQTTQITAVHVRDAEKIIRGEVGRNKFRMNAIP
jgi:hypothetical protein